jgi:hypothetical protein
MTRNKTMDGSRQMGSASANKGACKRTGENKMTLEQVKALADEELRIKVAELLGWRNIRIDFSYFDYQDDTGLIANDKIGYTLPLPDYPRDLNACHEMENSSLDFKQSPKYNEWLFEIACREGWHPERATARQRCEAFVLTMDA